MDVALLNTSRLALLLVPTVLGILAARLELFRDVHRAMAALNVFPLYFGFPALIVAGIVDQAFALPTAPGFWLVVPVTQLVLVALVPLVAKALRIPAQAGTLALVALFGNVAYLGLPLVVALLGEAHRGTAALLVSLHVGLAVGLGPLLLTRWSHGEPPPGALRRVLRQPLLWAPLVGLAGRFLPDAPRDALLAAVDPVGDAAAPVALFLLGIYLHTERARLLQFDRGVWAHTALRLLLAPAIAGGGAALFVTVGWLSAGHVPLVVLLAGMPTAITTFAIAYDTGTGADRVAAAIVWTTLLSLVTLPLLATLLRG